MQVRKDPKPIPPAEAARLARESALARQESVIVKPVAEGVDMVKVKAPTILSDAENQALIEENQASLINSVAKAHGIPLTRPEPTNQSSIEKMRERMKNAEYNPSGIDAVVADKKYRPATTQEDPRMGHNSRLPASTPSSVGGVSGERLTQLIERVERLEEDKAGLADDIRDVYAEAKSAGYETKIMRQLVKLRKMDRNKRQEMEELLDLYKSAIGLE